jgi:glycosyltransferase involved in cell wall biosynthesis
MTTVPNDLVLAVTAWCDAVDRGECMPTDRLVRAAVEDDRFDTVLVANPYRSAPVLWMRRLSGHGEPVLPDGPGRRRQVTPVRIRRHDPAGRVALERAHRRYARTLGNLAGSLAMTRPTVITANPFTAAYGDFGWARTVTYFAWDDWSAHPAFEKWRPQYDDAYARLREHGVRIAAVSEPLRARVAGGDGGVVVPNAVDGREWTVPSSPAPPVLAAAAPPRILYVGTLDGRLDVDAVIATARRFANGTVVLAGLVADPAHLAPLHGEANVVIAGPQGRADVVAMVRAADACVIPHLRSPLTETMSPLKLYEYLAGGRPVAATDLAPMCGIDDSVQLVGRGEPFEDAVARALERGPMSEAARLDFIRCNSWEDRMTRIFELAGVVTG